MRRAYKMESHEIEEGEPEDFIKQLHEGVRMVLCDAMNPTMDGDKFFLKCSFGFFDKAGMLRDFIGSFYRPADAAADAAAAPH